MFGDIGDMGRELLSDVTSVFDGGRKRITFACCAGVPYEVCQYLEALGVKVWPTYDIHQMEDGTIEATVLVNESQFGFAASLIAGAAPGSVSVLNPRNVRPIKPRTSWGAPNRSARGLLTSTARALAPTTAKTPPVRRKNNVR